VPELAFNPYSNEGHYGLELAIRLLHARRPATVALYTDNPEVAKAAVRRLGWVKGRIFVESQTIADAVWASLSVKVEAIDPALHVDVAFVPYSWRRFARPPAAPYIVMISRNKYSYKSLVAFGSIRESNIAAQRWLKQSHDVVDSVGLFTPVFMAQWVASLACGERWPNWHFRLGQRTLDRIYSSGLLHRLGYLVVVSGVNREMR
jgi:hypothetical protein